MQMGKEAEKCSLVKASSPASRLHPTRFLSSTRTAHILSVSQADGFLAFRSDKPCGILRSQFRTGKGMGQRNTKRFLPFSGWLNRAAQRVSLHGWA